MEHTERERLRRAVLHLAAEQNQLAERFLAEMEFAQGFLDLHPAGRPRWEKLIDRAWTLMRKAVLGGSADGLPAVVQKAEGLLAPIGKVAKTYTVHCVGHAHIDMNWMWSWPETVAVTNDTFLTVLRLMDEFPDFCFTQSQASVYAIARDYCPDLLDRIRRRAAEGRWEVAAVHWVEGDKNMASGESLARHLLYTRRFVGEQLGLTAEDVVLDWEPDTFGHAATIPTIVARGGVRRYYLCRGGEFEKPPVFWWVGPDGSRILVNRETTWYNDHIGPHNVPPMLAFCRQTGLRDWMCVYGVGDHGGGPTRRDIGRCHELNAWPIYPGFRLATTREYYQALEARGDWPTLEGELNFEFTGCYTSQSRIKRTNRLAENLLECAESASALAWRAVGREYPAQALRQAWIDALFGHFHDILPGSGVRETREYHMGNFQRLAAAASMATTHSLRALAEAINTSSVAGAGAQAADAGLAMGGGAGRGAYWGQVTDATHAAALTRACVAFNPSAWRRTETVKVTVWDSGDGSVEDQAFAARMPDGTLIPAQRLSRQAGDYWGHRFVELALPVTVGAMGYTAFGIEPAGRHIRPAGYGYPETVVGPAADMLTQPAVRFTGPLAVENEFLAVRFDSLTGGIVELVAKDDKAGGVNLADPDRPTGLIEHTLERPGPMTAWIVHPPRKRTCPLEVHALERTASGPHLAAITARMKIGESAISVTYSLKSAARWLEVDVEADWLERGSRDVGIPSLALRVPLALEGAKARYEIPFGSIERSLNAGQEVPGLRWADVTGRLRTSGGGLAGCALLNDSKYGHSLDGDTLRLTLIRSSYDPDPLPEIGRHNIRLALAPHAGVVHAADLTRMAAALNQPLQVLSAEAHPGSLPPAGAAIGEVAPAGIVLTGVKKAEDDAALIFRLVEMGGRPATARVALSGGLLGRPRQAAEVDFLERPLGASTAKATEDGFSVRVPAFGIASVRVTFHADTAPGQAASG